MADRGVAIFSPLPITFEADSYLAPSVGTALGVVKLFNPEETLPAPPAEGQIWPRGDYQPN